ncbi:hypothetical protein B9T24_09870 [Acinetobacter sp. ANC 4654]|uniref:tape measure protein n=1 Tax=Acinetobacter sp. ANC 4654 TaxID=1977872 RepID=UPI000A333661|nr:tape measure protein [Acinetobacter sp. ANC 4654]OTG95053.1 hypothetical protein B9T24_09870 [Acinetobacter sp. ANC 4654]
MAQESVLRIVIDSRNAERNAQNIARELQSIERNGDHASRSMDSMSVATRQLVGYMGGLVTIGAAINKMDTYTGLTNKLKLVTVNQNELNKAMGDTFKIAQNTAQAWDSVAQIYQRFSDNAKRLNITQAETASLTETVAKAISISGGSAASAEAALIQFSQALASNVLRGEELNSVMEQAPGLAKAIAQGMGITVGQLRSVAAEGKITGDVLVEALGKAKASVDDLFSKTDFTIAQSFTQLSNEVTKFVGEAGKSSGAANALSGSIKVLAENLELIANGAFVIGIGYATKAIAAKTVAIYSSIVATTASIETEKVSAAQALRSALAEKTAAEAELTRARDAVVSAEMQVQADRKVIASEMQRIESSLAQVATEKQLEIQRLKSQINDQGRIATSTRMAELQQVQASMTAELTVLERQLGATTVASSAQFVAAREAQVVATGNLAATTEVATLAQAQNNAVQRAGLLTSTSLVGALGGPLGLGITVAALAATYLMFKDSSDDVNDSLSSQIEVVSELAQKYQELTLAKLISEQDMLEKKLKNSESQSNKAIASLMGIATATEHSTDKQKKQSEEMNRIATGLRDGAITTGKALIQMRESGFTEDQIKKASAFFEEFDKGKAGANEAGRQIDYVSQQTGIYGDKLDTSTKKIADQKVIVNALSGDYKNLSDEMSKTIDWLLQQDGALNATTEQQKKVTDAVDAWKKGTIDATSVAKIFKANLLIDSSLLSGLDGLATKTDKAKKELNIANSELKQVQANGPKAKQGFSDAAQGAKDAKGEVDKLNEKLKDFNKTLYDRDFDANFKKMALERTKLSEKQIQAVMEVTQELRKKGVALDSDAAKQLYAETLRITKIEEQGNKIIDARNEAEKKITKEKEKQYQYSNSELKMLQNVASLSAKHDLDGIGAKYGIPKNYLAGLMAQESGGNPNAVSTTGAIGYYQTTSDYRKDNGISVADSKNLPVIAEVVAKNLAKAYKELGSWEAAIRSHNAGLSGSAQFAKSGKVKGGAARNKEVANFAPSVNKWIVGLGGSGLKNKGAADAIDDLKQYFEFLEEQAKLRKSLELNVANEVTKIRENLKDKLEEIDKAGFSSERTKELKAEYQARADNDIAIAQYALKTKLNDYESFRKSEEELLKESFDQKKFYAARDLELSKEDREKAVALLESQYQQELALVKLAKEQRMFQMREQFLSETAAMEERYRIEHLRLVETNNLEERNFKQQMLRLQKQEEVRNRLNGAVQSWGQTEAEMNGTGDQWQLEQTRFSRYGQSQELFDSQMSNLDQQEQDPTADLNEIALLREQAWFAHHDRLKKIETDYQVSSMQLQLSYGEQMASSMTTMMGAIFGEKSRAYAAAFAIEKGFAVAQAALAMGQNIAEASKAGFPYNIPLIAGAMAQGAQIASIISSVAAPTGYATGGLIRGPGTGTSDSIPIMASDKEFMIRAASVRKIGAENLDYINKYGELPQNTKRVGMGALDAINNSGTIQAEKQAQANAKVYAQAAPNVNLNPNFVIVDERQSLGDYLYGPDGKKAFVKFFKQNRRELGFA